MKRCPECRRDYYDDSLLYCLDDGTALLEGPASADLQSEAPTRASLEPADQTTILPNGITANERKVVGLGWKLWLSIVLFAVIFSAGYFGYRYFKAGAPINSIAVLPFQNRAGDADTEYLSEGLAESLIYRLSQLPDLNVSPTSSVFQYKGKDIDPVSVGRELGV